MKPAVYVSECYQLDQILEKALCMKYTTVGGYEDLYGSKGG